MMLTAKRQKILNQLSKLLDTPQVFLENSELEKMQTYPCWMFPSPPRPRFETIGSSSSLRSS